MAMPNYLIQLDRAAAKVNPFLIIVAVGLSMVDFTLAVDQLRGLQAGLPPPGEELLHSPQGGSATVETLHTLAALGVE